MAMAATAAEVRWEGDVEQTWRVRAGRLGCWSLCGPLSALRDVGGSWVAKLCLSSSSLSLPQIFLIFFVSN